MDGEFDALEYVSFVVTRLCLLVDSSKFDFMVTSARHWPLIGEFPGAWAITSFLKFCCLSPDRFTPAWRLHCFGQAPM